MTRILGLGLYYPPHHYGGYEVACRDVLSRFAARGHDVAVLTSDLRLAESGAAGDAGADRAGSLEVRDGVVVHRQLARWFKGDALYAPAPTERWRIERANQAALAGILDRFQPDVVSVWHMGALSLGLLTTIAERGIPLHFVICDDWLCYGPQLDAWSRMFKRLRWAAPLLRRILGVPVDPGDLGAMGAFGFISADTQRRAVGGSRWTFPDSAIVYMGIDRDLFCVESTSAVARDGAAARAAAETQAVAAAEVQGWKGRLLYVGRFDPRKGLETLVRAFARMPGDHHLEIQGTGDLAYRDHLARLAGQLGVAGRIDFSARLDRRDLVARYRGADCVVFPSEWDEPFGLVPVEAMGCGTPVVATGKGGSGEFLFDGVNCLTYPAGDAEGLAEAVGKLAADAGLRSRLVAAGFKTADYFDVERLTDTLEAWTVAAAERFVHGRPPSRHFDLALLGAEQRQAPLGGSRHGLPNWSRFTAWVDGFHNRFEGPA